MFLEHKFIRVICESPFLLFCLSPLPLGCNLSPVSSPHCRGQSFLVNACVSEHEDSGCYETLQGSSVGSRIQCPFLAPSTPVPGGARSVWRAYAREGSRRVCGQTREVRGALALEDRSTMKDARLVLSLQVFNWLVRVHLSPVEAECT